MFSLNTRNLCMTSIDATFKVNTTPQNLTDSGSSCQHSELNQKPRTEHRMFYCHCGHDIDSVTTQADLDAENYNTIKTLIESLATLLEKVIEKLAALISGQAHETSSTNIQSNDTTGTINTNNAGTSATTSIDDTSYASTRKPFKEYMSDFFKGNERLSEADLRNGIVSYQLSQSNPPLDSEYKRLFESARSSGKSVSASVASALKELSAQRSLKASDAEWVYSLSSRAAQLDDNLEYLRTTAGSSANYELKNALQIAEVNLASIQNGSLKVAMLNI
jgi:hypothetical protein